MITEGHLVRHFQGRTGGRGPAIIDIAQDHLLYHLAHEGIFELGVALKGGTAVRPCPPVVPAAAWPPAPSLRALPRRIRGVDRTE